MASQQGYDCHIDFSFLPQASYKATICRDGINADRNAMDYVIEEKEITRRGNANLQMAPGGGFIIRLLKE
jgi:alpha-glucosidase